MPMTRKLRGSLVTAVIAICALFAWFRFQPTVQAQDNLTPGMLFGPVSVADGETVELCFSLLSEGDLSTVIHFRNITTGEVTAGQAIDIKTGGGACASYYGPGKVIGMARATAGSSDWVSPSNALVSTMSVVTGGGPNNRRTVAVVQGVPKIWLKGL